MKTNLELKGTHVVASLQADQSYDGDKDGKPSVTGKVSAELEIDAVEFIGEVMKKDFSLFEKAVSVNKEKLGIA